MELDPSRAAFVKNEYRFATVENTSIKTVYPKAREIVFQTNLTDADALATTYFNEASQPRRAFAISIADTLTLSDFVDAPPRYTIASDNFELDGSTSFRAVSVDVDILTGVSQVVVSG